MTDDRDELLLVAAWRAPPGPGVPVGWRAEPVLADQSALDRAGSRGRTPPPFHTLLWRPAGPAAPETLAPPAGQLDDHERRLVAVTLPSVTHSRRLAPQNVDRLLFNVQKPFFCAGAGDAGIMATRKRCGCWSWYSPAA